MSFNQLIKSEESALEIILNSIKNDNSLTITYLNQHCFNIYCSDSNYKNLLTNSFTLFMDGFGVYTALKFLGYKGIRKFNATDLYLKLFNYLSKNRYKLFLIGGNFSKEFVDQKASENKLAIVGYQTGYFDEINLSTISDKIDESSAKLIVIGMGVPKQEFLASEISRFFPDKVILCVGNFLEFYFGTKRRAPKIFRALGFEWFHRLLTEPKRLWKRYLIGIPVFIFNIIKIKFSSTGL